MTIVEAVDPAGKPRAPEAAPPLPSTTPTSVQGPSAPMPPLPPTAAPQPASVATPAAAIEKSLPPARGPLLRLEIDPETRISEYIRDIHYKRPGRVILVGVGRNIGRAAWLSLVLEKDKGFRRIALDLDRVVEPTGLEAGRLTLVLER